LEVTLPRIVRGESVHVVVDATGLKIFGEVEQLPEMLESIELSGNWEGQAGRRSVVTIGAALPEMPFTG